MKRYCLALDLIDDPVLISEYEKWHENVWPEIEQSIRAAGVIKMEIYRTGNRLFMIMETDHTFTMERKSARDAENVSVQEWEQRMWKYQQALPWADHGEKWMIMKKIFSL